MGTVTAPEFLSLNEIQHRVVLAIGKSTFMWPPARLLPILPNGETEKLVSGFFFRQVSRQTWFLELMLIFRETLDDH
jgi:hypothetical protein